MAKQTKKQRFARHRTDPFCAYCHETMDPAGFAFEHYDAVGAWRTVDGAFPVDAAGAAGEAVELRMPEQAGAAAGPAPPNRRRSRRQAIAAKARDVFQLRHAPARNKD